MYNNQKIKKSYKDSNVTKMPISKNRGNRKNSGKWTIKYKKSINCRHQNYYILDFVKMREQYN